MGLIYKDNAPVKFITGNYVGHNSRNCFPSLHQFCQLVERADLSPYEVQVTSNTAELVIDSPFTTACGVNWTCGANWNIAAGKASKTAGGANSLTQPVQIMDLRYYRIVFDLDSISGGNLTLTLGGNAVATYTPADSGTQTEWIRLTGTTNVNIDFAGQAACVCQIDNVSLLEYSQISYEIEDTDGTSIFMALGVPGAPSPVRFEDFALMNTRWVVGDIPDEGCYVICNHEISQYREMVVNGSFFQDNFWTKGGGWTIAAGVASWNGAFVSNLSQTFLHPLQAGRCYVLTFTILNRVAGASVDVILQPSGINLGTFNSNGNKTANIDLTGFPDQTSIDIRGNAVGAWSLDVDDVSILMDSDCYEEDACSECYELADDWDDHNRCTQLIEWTNTENAFGFEYAGLSLTHTLRLRSELWKPAYPEERSEYENSSGTKTLLFGKSNKVSVLDIDVAPEYIHDALRLMRIHDTVTVDSVAVYPEGGDYEPDWKGNTEVASSEIPVRAKTENNVNENC